MCDRMVVERLTARCVGGVASQAGQPSYVRVLTVAASGSRAHGPLRRRTAPTRTSRATPPCQVGVWVWDTPDVRPTIPVVLADALCVG